MDYSQISASPLAWPAAQKRTDPRRRQDSRFKASRTVNMAIRGIIDQLHALGAQRRCKISTNLDLRLDGLPRSGQRMPEDPGAAVYFRAWEADHAMACDRYRRVEDNLWALAKTIEATRAIERYGVVDLREAFRGFVALPAPEDSSARPWWDVFGVPRGCSYIDAKKASRNALFRTHPDRGGSTEAFMAAQSATREMELDFAQRMEKPGGKP